MSPPAFIPAATKLPLRPFKPTATSLTSRPIAHRLSRRRTSPTMRVYDVEIQLYGETHMIPIDEDMTLLEGIEEYGLSVLYSCRAGVCVTCAAKILSGDVDLGAASITDDLKDQGYVLTCSGFPRSEGIRLEMNHFDDAYEKQYGQFEAGK
eukprot:GFKZ01014800.1.p2 GENE.GFKZ01014800.1~~GFKZ01014800.1.p2  ORF type:complete len:151 (+),score=24.57 GFKZ01014800.1:162-614(+)